MHLFTSCVRHDMLQVEARELQGLGARFFSKNVKRVSADRGV